MAKKIKKQMTSLWIEEELKQELDHIADNHSLSMGWLINYYIKLGIKSDKVFKKEE